MRDTVDPYAISGEIADRIALAETPESSAVREFVMTRAAEGAWSAINQQLAAAHGALIWLSGPSGVGKTHFLNYVTALNARAGALAMPAGRRLTLALSLTAETAAELDRAIAHRIGKALTGAPSDAALWRNLRGAEGLRVVLDQAKRQGVEAVTIAIDFDLLDPAVAASSLTTMAGLAGALARPRFTLIAAGRAASSVAEARAFALGAQADEFAAVAIGRARRLDEAVSGDLRDAYGAVQPEEQALESLFPFHPAAAQMLVALGGSADAIAPAARLAREVLLEARAAASPHALIWPTHLMRVAGVRSAVETRLGERGSAAHALALAAARAIDAPRRALAAEIVELLTLNHVMFPREPLTLAQLAARLTLADQHNEVKRAQGAAESARRGQNQDAAESCLRLNVADSATRRRRGQNQNADQLAAIKEVAAELDNRSAGVIVFDSADATLRLNEGVAAAPEVARFNGALASMRRFDATLMPAAELEEMQAARERLGSAMAAALESATGNRDRLRQAARHSGATLTGEQEQTFADFIAIAEAGPAALIAAAAIAEKRAELTRIFDDYDLLAVLAAATPRLRVMREYLEAMGLHRELEDDPHRDPALAKLEAECKLLLIGAAAAVRARAASGLDALESRFQRFKWTYVPFYRAAHEAWRAELAAATTIAEDAERHLAVLARLNGIRALGPPLGLELAIEFARLASGVARCTQDGALSPEIAPVCSRCNYVIGTPSPRPPLVELFGRVRRALEARLAALSQSAIARLIAEHDEGGRLEGFLRITQAAQTEALISVLDDELAGYLARLLDENPAADSASRVRVVQPLRVARADSRGPRSHKGQPRSRLD
ncbi:MAG TPA: hypothetical protein VKS22_03980 [Candidatus Binataceae bacterium]|nr:hypothetical protein [Candidatus Binataceae bacterium]